MDWYNKLTPSERKLLNYGGLIVALVMLWLFVYQPVTKSKHTKQQQVIRLTKQYKEMQASESLLKIQKIKDAKFIRANNKPFISWIDDQLEKMKLSDFVTRSEPKDSHTLILSFENVVFDNLATWLQNLEQNYHIKITEADINLTDRSSGLCNARLTLQE